MTVLTTERLILRDWTDDPADLARIYDIYSRPEISRWLGASPGLPMTDRPRPPSGWVSGGSGTPPTAVGTAPGRSRHARPAWWWSTALLKPLPGRDEALRSTDIEVGWHLHPDSWGHGFATEAARALVAREFATGTSEIYAVVSPGNEPSMAVCRRLGMAHVGRRTDWYGGEELETFVLTAPDA
ncbi:GNAT family N-acetyltransferase [Micromonospora sp. M12]